MDEFESPFARTPTPGVGEPPSGLTYEGQIAQVGQLASGLRGRPTGVRAGARLIVLIPLIVLLGAILLGACGFVWSALAG